MADTGRQPMRGWCLFSWFSDDVPYPRGRIPVSVTLVLFHFTHPSVIHAERPFRWRDSMTLLISGSRNAVLVAKSHSHFGPTNCADGDPADRPCEIARPHEIASAFACGRSGLVYT